MNRNKTGGIWIRQVDFISVNILPVLLLYSFGKCYRWEDGVQCTKNLSVLYITAECTFISKISIKNPNTVCMVNSQSSCFWQHFPTTDMSQRWRSIWSLTAPASSWALFAFQPHSFSFWEELSFPFPRAFAHAVSTSRDALCYCTFPHPTRFFCPVIFCLPLRVQLIQHTLKEDFLPLWMKLGAVSYSLLAIHFLPFLYLT